MWEYLAEAKSAFPDVRMVEMKSPELKKNVKLLLPEDSSVALLIYHRAVKLTFPTEVGDIVSDGRTRTDIGSGRMGQSVAVPTDIDF